jgi:glucokinase
MSYEWIDDKQREDDVKTSCTIGVDLGGQSVKLAVVDDQGNIRLKRQSPIDASKSVDYLTQQILGEIRLLTNDALSAGFEPTAVGMVMPGYMDRERTRLTFAANIPALSGSTFLADLRAGSPLPMRFDADSNAAALAESRFGAGRGVDRLIVVAVGTGIGGGVIVNGEVLRVREHIAGSLGHVTVDARGPRCKCGGRGCVEALASGPVLERLAGEFADADPGSMLAALRAERGRITGVEIVAALQAGDAAAQKAVDECGWWLGAGVASWSVIYAPRLVLIAGGIACIGEPLLAAVRRGFEEVGMPNMVKQARIGLATLGPDAGVIGAAATAMQD